MRAIHDHDELTALCAGDTLCLWAAQDLDGRGRAWASDDGRAVAVAGHDISRRDRIAVHGQADAAVPLVEQVLAEVGPTYRPLGDPGLIGAVVAGVPVLAPTRAFGWMETTEAPAAAGGARWLTRPELPEAAALLDVAFPTSDARPGSRADERWAGLRDDAGRLVALAALVWPAPSVGLIAGVAVHPDARGLGLGRTVCAFVAAEAVARHGTAALMVDEWNRAAVRLYQGLGMRYRPLLAAHVQEATARR
ncbi:GNAT family N-acetyltransferase [Actinoallomurus sp. CA-142502]|uniref:GNAT family N-acetyltransferase n=1 Tax=Actinoallomurus sp. CA-142502 TaxID=3239885 RepID=UPI003D91C36F